MNPNILIIVVFIFIVLSLGVSVYFLFGNLVNNSRFFRTKRKLLLLYKIEFIGHTLLIVSIAWLFISNPLAIITTNSEIIKTQQKLDAIYYRINRLEDNIYEYAELKKEPANSIKWVDFNNRLMEYNRIWNNSNIESDEVESQSKLSSILSVVLLLISTILIAIGRIGDVMVSLNRKQSKYD